MSAITGIFMRNGKDVDPELMKKMNEKLSHRGPDGSAIWCDGPMGLGHQMLWTTQESLHEKLPLEENNLVITADARIDNRDELSKELGLRDEEDVSDSYFILKAYEMWGDDCPDKLLGDFAFAIWDKKEEKLFCARDHMGVKPFYYYLDDDMFVFGTEIKAIFANEIPKKLNELRVADHLTGFFEDKEITFYEKIKRLPAASTFSISINKEYIKNYWIIDIEKILNLNSNKEYSDAFRDIFTESVRCRLRSAFPIGSTLSGGLDSSSIVCTAKQILSEDYGINTFSAVFDSVPQSDESYFINTVLKEGGMNPNFIHGDKITPLYDLDKVLWHLDEPLYAPNLFLNWNIYIKSHDKGIRVILDGFDGDSTISHGEKYLAELAQNMSLKTLISEIIGLSKNLNISINKLLFYQVITPLIPLTMKNILINKLNFIKNNNNNFNGMELNTDFISRNKISKRYETLKQKNTNVSREYHYNYIRSGIQQFVLEVLDKSSSAFSLEPRYPFFDARLIEFCLSLPTEQKLFRGWDRIILRRAMKGILPQEVQWRQKKANLGHNFKNSFILFEKNNMKKVLLNNDNMKNFVNIDILNKTYENKIQTNTLNVWKTVNLALWLNKTDFRNYNLIKNDENMTSKDENYY
jgi:asparagine synthase (glutamine-hydrolysing)